MPGFPFPEFIKPDPYIFEISYIVFKGKTTTISRTAEQEKIRKIP
jgi:hypothetical protein